jgi:hypothetical protein
MLPSLHCDYAIVVHMIKSKNSRIITVALPVVSVISKRRKPSIQVAISGTPDTLFFAGFGNEGASLGRIVRLLESEGIKNVAVVGPLPYWHIPATAADLSAFGITGVIAAAEYIRKEYKTSTLHAVGESQTAGALAHAAVEHPHVFNGNLGLLRPLGLTTMTRKEFKTGLRKGMIHPDQFLDWRAWPVGVVAAWRVLQDRLRHGGKQFDLGITWDSRQELKKLYAQRREHVRIFAAEDDRLYSVQAIETALKTTGISADILEVIPGMHASPATRAGSLQVAHAVAWARATHESPL